MIFLSTQTNCKRSSLRSRNVECDFLGDFQTLCNWVSAPAQPITKLAVSIQTKENISAETNQNSAKRKWKVELQGQKGSSLNVDSNKSEFLMRRSPCEDHRVPWRLHSGPCPMYRHKETWNSTTRSLKKTSRSKLSMEILIVAVMVLKQIKSVYFSWSFVTHYRLQDQE